MHSLLDLMLTRLYLSPDLLEELFSLLKQQLLHIVMIDLGNITEALLIGLVQTVEFLLQFLGDQGCEHELMVEVFSLGLR